MIQRPSSSSDADHAGGDGAPRKLTRVLMRLTIILTVSLGVLAGGFQMLVDLKQEKDAVEINATDLVESMAPTAGKAVYNFDQRGAEQVAAGLFTQRAVGRVVIWESDNVFVDRDRDVTPTLPKFGAITMSDLVVIERPLYAPASDGGQEVIGRLMVTVDRAIVPPAIVDRMLMYFTIAVLKNFVLGALLIWVVFSRLASHVLRLAKVVEAWSPHRDTLSPPPPPNYLRGTEIDVLGQKIARLASSARSALRTLETSNEEINQANVALRGQSDELSNALQERNADLQRLNQELAHLADRDSLTKLHNRRYFDRKSQEIWTDVLGKDRNASVLIIDIDHFKAYNDFYGHQQGDACLSHVASTLKALFGDTPGIVARYGGEEFIVFVPLLSDSEADALATRLVDGVAALEIEHARSLTAKVVTVSIGVASRDRLGVGGLSDLVGAADRALYTAKAEGRGRRIVASPDLLGAVQHEEEITQRILEAIRTRAFEPFYQPQVDARTGALAGLETLGRWRKPDGSIAPPAAFLPKAEMLGLAGDIDAIIQEKALTQLRAWREMGLAPERFSINMSESRLLSGNVHALFARFPEVNDGRLSVELLEAVFFDEQSTFFKYQLDQLREMGVAIEVDDFGTGHSSISSLAAILPERIKIARELVAPLGADARAAKVVEAVVEMAQAFDIAVIAEGVETQQQADLLIALNCPIQQGYFHGRPVSAAETEQLLQDQRAVLQKQAG